VEITDERTGLVHDYTRKGGVLHSELILPGGGTADRAEFWNGVEAHHKRGDAVLVREVEISLPTELTAEQRKALAVGYARALADRYGVAADVALHAPRTITDRELEKHPDQYHETDPKTGRRHNGNWHAHILLSACHVQPDGTLGKKAVELDPIHCQRAKIENLVDRERVRWGDLANAALERHGHAARIDHRSHAKRGIAAEPTRHLGPAAAGIERRTGEESRRRHDFEREAMERLARAQAQGVLERESGDWSEYL
jgi:MobA/MobL family.